MKKIDLNEVLTASEAEEVYGLVDGQVRQDIRRGRFKEDEFRKSGRNWLLTRNALARVYSNRKAKQ